MCRMHIEVIALLEHIDGYLKYECFLQGAAALQQTLKQPFIIAALYSSIYALQYVF